MSRDIALPSLVSFMKMNSERCSPAHFLVCHLVCGLSTNEWLVVIGGHYIEFDPIAFILLPSDMKRMEKISHVFKPNMLTKCYPLCRVRKLSSEFEFC